MLGLSCQSKINRDTNKDADTTSTTQSIRGIEDFNEIEISGAIDVHLVQGNQEGVNITASTPELASKVKTKVVGGVLKIYTDDINFNWNNNTVIKAEVTYTHLDKVDASGACSIVGKNINTPNLIIGLTGASNFEGSVQVDNLDINLSGACKIKLSGNATHTNIAASGACIMKAYRLKTNFCKVDASGASNIYITVAKEITGEASGGSNVYYKGEGVAKDIDASGGANFAKSSEDEE